MAKKAPTSSAAKAKHRAASKQSADRVSAEDFPRRSLHDAVPIAKILKDVYAGGNATWEEIAKALGVNASYPTNKYPLWAATAYGIVNAEGAKGGERRYSLSEIGRKIVAETYEGEAQEGKIKALLTPVILSKFLTEYNGHQIPAPQFFP